MKLIYKLNLVSLGVLIVVSCVIAGAGLLAINQVTFDLNRKIMSREVNELVKLAATAHQILRENRIEHVESYLKKAHADVITDLKGYRYGRTGCVMILNMDGSVVLDPDLAPGQASDLAILKQIVQQKQGSLEHLYRGEKRLFSFQLFPEWNWIVVLSIASKEIGGVGTQFLQRVTFILLISLVGGSLIFIWFMARVTKPIRQLAAATDEISRNKWDAPLPKYTGKDEIAQLTAAFGKMAIRLSETYKDLTENLEKVEKSQQALHRSERKYRELVELLPEVVFETNDQGTLLFANDIAFDSFGYDRTILSRNVSIYDMIVPEDRPRAIKQMKRILAGKKTSMMEFSGLRKDGSRFPALAMACPIVQENRSVGLRGIFVDITERKALEDRLKRTQNFLQDILNNVADPVFVKDEAHRWILVNDAYCRITGLKREDLLGKSDYDFFAKEEADVFWEKDDLVFSSQTPNENEEIFTDPDGNRHIFLTKKTVFKDDQGNKILVGISKDITQRKHIEQEIFKSQKLESVGILAGGIAHDFNNILMAVIGNLSLAATMISPADAVYETILETKKAALRARDLTQQLLTFSRGGAPVKRTVDLNPLIKEFVTFALRGSNVRCEFKLQNLSPVQVDEGQISQVISNLVLNACQAMPDGGSILVESGEVHLNETSNIPLPPGDYIRLSIQDHGTGIPAEHMSKVFDPYFTTKPDGTGLGLATAYSIIKRHGGLITAKSLPGLKTTFHIFIPTTRSKISDKQTPLEQPIKGDGRILVMDDEEIVCTVVGAMLRHLGYDSEFASDGTEALEKYATRMATGQPFDAVIMDLTIPGGMGGKEAIGKLLALDPGAIAIVSSGYSSDPVMADYAAYGFAGVIAKPFEMKDLGNMLHALLHKNCD